jgi:von Willebrand factor type A domain/Aerotolerance regulator N-terminal
MMFSAAGFLYLLPLASLPIIFHLIYKQKKRAMVFSTLMFLHRASPKLNSRRRLRELLLLAMRVLLIAFVLLALSRPVLRITTARVGHGAAVVIVDNSGSMGAVAQGGGTKLEMAAEGARNLLKALPRGSETALLLLVDEPSIEVARRLTTDRDKLLATLGKLRPTQATGDAGEALARAFAMLAEGAAQGGVVHVFTDLQEAEWKKTAMPSPQDGAAVSVVFHRINSKPWQVNVALSGIELPKERSLPRQPCAVGVALRNISQEAASVRLHTVDSLGHRTMQNVSLAPFAGKTVKVSTEPDSPGIHWMNLSIEGDDFAADNQAGVAIACEETATVLFAGVRGEYGVLPVALSPYGDGRYTGMVLDFHAVETLLDALQKRTPIMLVVTWGGIENLITKGEDAALREYVESGGNLLIVPSLLPRLLPNKLPDWLGVSMGKREARARGVALSLLNRRSDFWTRIRQEAGGYDIPETRAFLYHTLKLTKNYTPLLSADKGRIVLAQGSIGKGNIYLSGTAFDLNWNTLPLGGLLVVMTQRMAICGSADQSRGVTSLEAGERPGAIASVSGAVELVSLVGEPIDWKGDASDIPAFPRSGVYLLSASGEKHGIAVRPSGKEASFSFITGNNVEALGTVAHVVSPYDGSGDFDEMSGQQAKAINLYLFLLFLAMLALLAEGLLANPSQSGKTRIKKPEAVASGGAD